MRYFYKNQKYKECKVEINNKVFRAIIADSFMKRAIGLMFRNGIAENTCMLFIFPNEARQGIWMHNMRFAIDVIWLDSERRIVSLENDIKPCKSVFNCKTYLPDSGAKYIIEMKAGTVNKNKIKKGLKVSIH